MMRITPTITIAFAILLLPLLLAVSLIGTTSAQACNKTWTSPVNGLWTDEANWTPAIVPGLTDNVCISVDGSYTVTLRGSSRVNSVTLGAAGNSGVQTLLIQGVSAGRALLTASTGFTNSGDITLSSIDTVSNVFLVVTSGTLINQGTINVESGTGGTRDIRANMTNNGMVNLDADTTVKGTLNGSLVNNGTMNLNANTTFETSGGVYTNNGTLNIATGRTLSITGISQVFNQNSGDLAISGDFSFSTATFNFNGGNITGTPVLFSSALSIGTGATTAASFTIRGTSTLEGDIAVGQSVLAQGGLSAGRALLTASTGFTNSGDITLSSIDTVSNVFLVVTSGTLINQGTINVETSSGGNRTLSAVIDNRGEINFDSLVKTRFEEVPAI